MSYNGSGTFAINSTGQPVVAGTVISSTVFNSLTADLGTGLSTAITKDGQTTTTARILFAAGISSTLATDASSISTGSILTLGGLGVTKAAWIGGLMNVAGAATFQSTIGITGALTATTINASGLVAMAAAATVGTTLAVSGTATMAAINASGTATLSQSSNSELEIAFFRNTSNGASAGTWVSWGNDAGVASGAIAMSSSTNTTKPSYFDIFNRTNTGPLRLGTNNTARLTIDSAGAVTIPGTLGVTTGIGCGAATPQTGGLAFPATQIAVANANTLDDYEEGTFSAAISTASGTVSTSDTTGYYTKIGNQVSVRGYLNVSGVSSPSGAASITGLPFTAGGTYIAASIYLVGIAGGAITSVQAYVSPSGTTITVVIYNAGARVEAGPYFQTNAQVMYSATYNV